MYLTCVSSKLIPWLSVFQLKVDWFARDEEMMAIDLEPRNLFLTRHILLLVYPSDAHLVRFSQLRSSSLFNIVIWFTGICITGFEGIGRRQDLGGISNLVFLLITSSLPRLRQLPGLPPKVPYTEAIIYTTINRSEESIYDVDGHYPSNVNSILGSIDDNFIVVFPRLSLRYLPRRNI